MIKIVHIIIYFLIIGIFIFNLPEYAFNLSIIPVRLEDSPIYIKIGKDIGIALIIIVGYLHIMLRKKMHKYQSYFIFFPIYIIICCYITQNINLCIAGIRWILPFILIGVLFQYVNENFLKNISRILFPLLIVQIVMQFVELFIMPHIDGDNAFGLAARVPGFFYAPNAAANFVLISFHIIQSFYDNKNIKDITSILVFISLLLMMSSAGTLIFILLIFLRIFYDSKYFKLILLIAPSLLVIIFLNLDTLTGRADGSTVESGSTRVSIFQDALKETSIISNNFGEATNTAMGLNLEDGFIADSNIVALYHNLGLIGFFYIIFIFFYSLIFNWQKRNIEVLQFLIMFFLLNIPTILFEVYPTNILSSILIAYYLKKESEKKCSSMYLKNIKER